MEAFMSLQPPPLPPLNWLRAFEAAARLMSFTQAGREIGVTQSAISQNVRLLEAHLGERLFDRLPHRLELTECGKAYLPAVQDGFRRIGSGTREVFGPVRRERVTLRATPGFAVAWLAPRLGDFYARAPEVNLRVVSTIWDIEFEAGAADLEVRYGDGNWSGMHCERLTRDRVFPVASPQVAARLAAEPGALAGERLLHTIGFRVTWPRWLDAAGFAETVDGSAGDHFDTAVTALALAERGVGVALARTSLAAEQLARGTLVAPFATALDTDEAFFLVWPTNAALPPEAERLVGWLRAQAA
jgi:LysR family glycine cleavage system transcriptional activator